MLVWSVALYFIFLRQCILVELKLTDSARLSDHRSLGVLLSPSPSHPHTGITKSNHHALIFAWFLGIQTQVLVHAQEALYQWSKLKKSSVSLRQTLWGQALGEHVYHASVA